MILRIAGWDGLICGDPQCLCRFAEKDKPKPPREPSPGPEPGPEYQCGNCGYVSDKPGRCPRCGETI